MQLTLTALQKIPLIREGDDLAEITLEALKENELNLQDGDILVLAQKIVSKAEGRLVDLNTISPSPRAKKLANKTEKDPRVVELILQESAEILRHRPGVIITEHRLGFVCANAGIDQSNTIASGSRSDDWALLLPKDPDASAQAIKETLETATGFKMGILIIDSHGRAWRIGATGTVVGLAGVPGIIDLRGKSDLFGRRLHSTIIGAADELAAGASLLMGEAAESRPIVHARGFPYPLRKSSLMEILRPKEQDLFR
jgi:coenzyme F420-0:L-glutamate ligase/coenzyme F420-1:gamma-L-glutamate ligase